MTTPIALVLLVIGIALVLFSFEWVAADVVALAVLLALILLNLIPADEAFAGFGSETVIMLLGLFILTAALIRTGVIQWTGRTILRYTGTNPNRLLVVILVTASSLSAFISNTASTAFFVPIVLGVAERARISASRLLMPLAFATILASSITLVSTSTNIVISGLLTQYGLPPLGMFELSPVGIPIAITGLLYMYFIGRRLIPDRAQVDTTMGNFRSRLYMTEVQIRPDSPLVGKTIMESGIDRELDLKVLRLVRGADRDLIPFADRRLSAGDVMLLEGSRDEILKIGEVVGLDIQGDMKFSGPKFAEKDIRLVEAILIPQSPLVGHTLSDYRFRHRYGLQVLAIYRHGETIRRKLSRVRLQTGDVLLLQTHRTNSAAVTSLEEESVFQVLGTVNEDTPLVERAPIAVATFVLALGAAAFNLVTLPVAVLLGALVIFLTRCLTPEEAYRRVEWRALILIGCMLAVGRAMEHTGTDQFLADQIVRFLGGMSPLWLLTGFFFLAVLLTQPMSNQAAAIVVVPVAIQTALQLDLNPRTFAMMIAVAASTSYLTPLEPACLMVYGPGGYRFSDFLKVGSLLTLIVFLISLLLVPLVWPL